MTSRQPVPMPTTDAGTTALAALTGGAQRALLSVDPRELHVEANVRSDLALTSEFVSSVRDGLQQHPTVYYDALGVLTVWVGHRRVVAAIEAGLDRIEVVLTDGPGDEWERIRSQFVENEHRAAMSASDRIEVFRQGSLFGRSAESLARETRTSLDEVERALAVVQSDVAVEVAAKYDDLEAASYVAEFAGDEAAVASIVASLEDSGDVRHVVAIERGARREAEMVAARIAELDAAGINGVSQLPGDATKEARLWELTDRPAATGEGPALVESEHADGCPAHAVLVRPGWRWEGTERVLTTSDLAYCLDWKTAGHFKIAARNTSGATSGPKSEEDKAAARELRENRKQADVEKSVRTNWWREFLQRRTFPAEATLLAARLVAIAPEYNASTPAAWELLGVDGHRSYQRAEALKRVNARRTAVAYLLAHGVAAFENDLHRDYFVMPKDVAGLRETVERREEWLQDCIGRARQTDVSDSCFTCGCDLRYPTAVHIVDCPAPAAAPKAVS